MLTSVTWNLAPLVTSVGKSVMDGTWKSENLSLGVASGAVQFAPFHDLESVIPADVLEKVEAKRAEIAAGKFEVPHDTTPVD